MNMQMLINQIYLLSVILFIFFYGYRVLFSIMKNTKIRGEVMTIMIFIILVLVLSVSIDFLTSFLLGLGTIGKILVAGVYIATYFEFKREMRRK